MTNLSSKQLSNLHAIASKQYRKAYKAVDCRTTNWKENFNKSQRLFSLCCRLFAALMGAK